MTTDLRSLRQQRRLLFILLMLVLLLAACQEKMNNNVQASNNTNLVLIQQTTVEIPPSSKLAGSDQDAPIEWGAAPPCDNQPLSAEPCANLYITQFNSQPMQVTWSSQGMQMVSQPQAAMLEEDQRKVKDTGKASPDGRLAAFTSLGYETGGPVWLLDLESQQWTNLIAAVNANLPKDQPALQEDLLWDIIGWFPDSRQLMIGPSELSSVFVIDLENDTFRPYTFNSGSIGGSSTVQLSPDGSRFIYTGYDPSGQQALFAYDLKTGQVSPLLVMKPEDGILTYPRFSPDGSTVAFVVEKGDPLTGLSYALNLLTLSDGSVRELVTGSLGQSIPTWSPDGQRIAFVKKDSDKPEKVIPEQAPPPGQGNIWVLDLSSGEAAQVTYLDGWARSPAWDFDSRTLAFVTENGEVGMVDVERPGEIWLAAETSPESPLFTSVFFIP